MLHHPIIWFHSLKDEADRIAVLGVLVAFLGALATLFVGIVGAWFASIAGAKRGAKAAFDLGQAQQAKDLEEKQYNALIVAQFALVDQWREICSLASQHLEKWHDDPMRHLRMPSSIIVSPTFSVPLEDIAFIAHSKEPSRDADVLFRVQLAQHNYTALIETFKAAAKEKDAVLNNKELVKGFDPKSQEWMILNDAAGLAKLLEATELLYNQLAVSVLPMKQGIEALGKYIQKRFPNRTALDLTNPDGSTIFGGKPLNTAGPPPKE